MIIHIAQSAENISTRAAVLRIRVTDFNLCPCQPSVFFPQAKSSSLYCVSETLFSAHNFFSFRLKISLFGDALTYSGPSGRLFHLYQHVQQTNIILGQSVHTVLMQRPCFPVACLVLALSCLPDA